MKKIAGILAIGFLVLQAFTFGADELSKKDRKSAITYLTETSDYFTSKVKGLSDAQLDFKAEPGKWSVRECMEHIALSESFIFTAIENSVKQTSNPEKKSEIKVTDDVLKNAVVDRSKKVTAPEPIQPTGKFKTADEAITVFINERNKHIDYLKTTKDDLRNHISPHPFFGMLDAYQWMLLLCAHGKRHTLQIEEVMASPSFPKS